MVAQGIIGYTQFFTHLPPLLVGIHVLGAAVVWSATLWYFHGTSDHDREDGRDTRRADRRRWGWRHDRPGRGRQPGRGRDRGRGARRGPGAGGRGGASARTGPWLVIVWNDPINLMSFVTFVFQKLFGYSKEKATRLMLDVHEKGRAVVSSGTRERAELDVFRLHEYGLWATMEQSG